MVFEANSRQTQDVYMMKRPFEFDPSTSTVGSSHLPAVDFFLDNHIILNPNCKALKEEKYE